MRQHHLSKIIIIIFILGTILIYFNLKNIGLLGKHSIKLLTYRKEAEKNVALQKISTSQLQQKVVHLDLKGAPPKIEYLKSILPVLKAAGATGILIEYEDMFPFKGTLQNITALNSYSENDLLDFLKEVKSKEMVIIPLLQTFGHLQYVLKLKEYRELREEDGYPDSICPSKESSITVLKEMLKQIVNFHSQIDTLKWFHIGCDEVYHINTCLDCRSRHLSSKKIFIDHVKKISSYVKKLSLMTRPLIWDDMLRNFKPSELEASKLNDFVEIVVWQYADTRDKMLPHRIWYQYSKFFNNIWIASAFKGAFGETQLIPDLSRHYKNHLIWLNFTTNYSPGGSSNVFQFRGIFLTGWSRYSHFTVLCETLPVSLPSLILNLLLVKMYLIRDQMKLSQENLHGEVLKKWFLLLECPNTNNAYVPLNHLKNNQYIPIEEFGVSECLFKGNNIYKEMFHLKAVEGLVIKLHIKSTFSENGFLQYNINNNMVSNDEILKEAKTLETELTEMTINFRQYLCDFFDNYTIEEFIEYKIEPLEHKIKRLIHLDLNNKKIRVWQRRPLKVKKSIIHET